MNYNICRPGERIKRIRIQIRMKQSELSGTNITRNLVSMIENGKSALTMKTAMILSDNINSFCEKKELSFRTTPSELMYSEEAQAKDICNEFIKLVNNLGEEFLKFDSKTHLDRIKAIMNEYNLNYEKAIIYEMIGRLYIGKREFEKATMNLYLAYEYMTKIEIDDKSERLADIILKLVHGKKAVKLYEEALSINFSFRNSIFFGNCTRITQSRIIYNNAVCLKKANLIEDCIHDLLLLEEEYTEAIKQIEYREIEIKILKGNALGDSQFISEAIKTHKGILNETKISLEFEVITYCNLIEIFIRLKDNKGIEKTLSDAEVCFNEYSKTADSRFANEVYRIIGSAYKSLNDRINSEKYFLKCYEISRIRKIKDTLESSLEQLIELYTCNSNFDKLNNVKNFVLECCVSKLINPSSIVVINLIGHYNKLKDYGSIESIINVVTNTFKREEL